MDSNIQKKLERASKVAKLLDSQFNLFGIRFGINLLLDFIPEVGDLIAFFLSLYIIQLAISLKAPKVLIAQMLLNISINFLLGLIPVVGEATYVFRKANLQNLALLKSYIQKQYITVL